MARLPLIDEASASEPVRASLAGTPPQGTVYRMLAHAENVFPPLLKVVGAIHGGLTLEARQRELAILRVATLADCEYERVQHEMLTAAEGVSADQIAEVTRERVDVSAFDERDALVLGFVDEVIGQAGASEATMAAMTTTFSPREIVELLVVIGQYHGLALLLNSTALEPMPPLSLEAIEQARARRAALPD